MGLYFDEFEIGRTLVSRGRTVGEGDVTLFAGLSGDFTPIHMDEHASRQGPFGGRIAHGTLTLSIAVGLMAQMNLFDGTVVALLNLNWDFAGVVRIGDTIRARITPVDKRLTSNPERGVVTLLIEVENQNGETVTSGRNTVLVLTRTAA